MPIMKSYTPNLTHLQVPKIYEERDGHKWSLILYSVAGVVFILRKVSLFENLKNRLFAKGELVPAVFLEIYLAGYWALTVGVLIFLPSYSKALSLAVIALSVLQTVQANVYHEFLRPAYRRAKGWSDKVAHSRLRSFAIGLLNYCFVTVLFGFAYWILAPNFGQPPIGDIEDCIYFSFTYAWSAGSRSVAPQDIGASIQLVIIAQIVTTLFLVAALLSTAVASLRPVEERERSPSDQGGDKCLT